MKGVKIMIRILFCAICFLPFLQASLFGQIPEWQIDLNSPVAGFEDMTFHGYPSFIRNDSLFFLSEEDLENPQSAQQAVNGIPFEALSSIKVSRRMITTGQKWGEAVGIVTGISAGVLATTNDHVVGGPILPDHVLDGIFIISFAGWSFSKGFEEIGELIDPSTEAFSLSGLSTSEKAKKVRYLFDKYQLGE